MCFWGVGQRKAALLGLCQVCAVSSLLWARLGDIPPSSAHSGFASTPATLCMDLHTPILGAGVWEAEGISPWSGLCQHLYPQPRVTGRCKNFMLQRQEGPGFCQSP